MSGLMNTENNMKTAGTLTTSVSFVSFVVPIAPKPMRIKTWVHGKFAKKALDAGSKTAQAQIALAAHAALGSQIFEGPLALSVVFVLPRPRSLLRAKDPEGLVLSVKRPDIDNLTKQLLDGMRACWRDDAQVVSLMATKYYAEKTGQPRIEVRVSTIN